ncbi:MAG TPA: hypothetical protein VFI22_10010 [Thermomicrobiales bacterium]|nr:hypothetical protein [Thermomicrobiales bacterium]
MTSPFQRSFADFCRATGDWRRRKAEEYDRDARNLRTAAALDALAEHVLTLAEDDPRLRELERLAGAGGAFTPDQRVLYELGRFRFHHPEAQLDPFLDVLVELAAADRGEHGRFGGKMAPGDDPWG